MSVAMTIGDDAPRDALGSAAYCPGVPRLGIPAWDESDASLGVTNPNQVRGEEPATAFPSLSALGATFDRDLAEEMGRALGEESRQKGFSVQLAGGVNLVREPRGGRIFEYIGEDPLLSGVLAGAQTAGIQAEGVVSTLKHFALNPQETGRVMVSSTITEQALRESDLLAFEIALEIGGAMAVMPGYNMVNGKYASENHFLLTEVLKGDWRFPGFVMSDWGATHSTVHAAMAGLDRQSGRDLDTEHFFGDALMQSVQRGDVPVSRLDDMVLRILTALDSVGALSERRRPGPVSFANHATVSRRVAEASIVLLANDSCALPLDPLGGRIAIVGHSAHIGVLAGGGSTTVTPPGSDLAQGLSIPQMDLPRVHHAPAPLTTITAAFPDREVVHVSPEELHLLGDDDVAVVIVEKWSSEGADWPDLSLGDGQDDVITTTAAHAGTTVVVLETAGPVLMPWIDSVDAVLAAWYGGDHGADAMARVLSGDVCPGGRVTVTWPHAECDLPRPRMTDPSTTTSFPGAPRKGGYFGVDYDIEGADVGYRWYERERLSPQFWFGHGLSYTTFDYRDISVEIGAGGLPVVSLTIENTGDRAGVETPQVYIAPPAGQGQDTFRLAAFHRVRLHAGEASAVQLVLTEERVYSSYDPDGSRWTRAAGDYLVRIGRRAGHTEFEACLRLTSRTWGYADAN
ncbi:beta-glucosidase [Rhodococcoides kroppenstedtii]|uniref:beta-glucosidase n=1 Tax=Rhodococcoides kroppenstedtii TaxID=293050 RepID=UPI00138F5243|nr:beta-glucosidase [Rhodococcus kroppenstedtii]MBY6312306.1 beta-glucosidase [Rhodococcus kroppenstedtii]MBY6398293.1 beta-glucosidase [Rhodococcus kroppenstedtii]